MRTRSAFEKPLIEASKSVLLELMTMLASYREALVLVGGWVPYLLLERNPRPGAPFAHVGSIDIDVAVDPAKISAEHYATILTLLEGRGYQPVLDRNGTPIPNSFARSIVSGLDEKEYKIHIDFLTHEEDARAGQHRHLELQDGLHVRKCEGCQAAFEHKEQIEFEGLLPNGSKGKVQMQIADVTGCLTMKGIVLGERFKEKDAYDIYAIASQYGDGASTVADAIRPWLGEPLVQKAIERIREAFSSRDARGPGNVADFLQSASPQEREAVLTASYMAVNEILGLAAQARRSNTRSVGNAPVRWNEAWFTAHRHDAEIGIQKAKLRGYMEVRFTLVGTEIRRTQKELLGAARAAQIMNFGWPVGIVLDEPDFRPKPRRDGILAEISGGGKASYDYWALRQTGEFYLLQSFFENERDASKLSCRLRVYRLAETLLYCVRLYSRLQLPGTSVVGISITHAGVQGRALEGPGARPRIQSRIASDEMDAVAISCRLEEIEPSLPDMVRRFGEPLFMLFDFYELPNEAYASIIQDFREGKLG